jgi:tRNA(Arg) A34 adenosine deaminase TadA
MAIEVPNHKRHDRIMQFLIRQAQDNAPNESSKHVAFSKEPEKYFLHAEVSAIRKSLNHISADDLKKSSLYVARVMKNGSWGYSCPCLGCKMAISAFDIKKVIFTTGPLAYHQL